MPQPTVISFDVFGSVTEFATMVSAVAFAAGSVGALCWRGRGDGRAWSGQGGDHGDGQVWHGTPTDPPPRMPRSGPTLVDRVARRQDAPWYVVHAPADNRWAASPRPTAPRAPRPAASGAQRWWLDHGRLADPSTTAGSRS